MKPRTVEETRLINGRKLAKDAGGITALARKVDREQSFMQSSLGKTVLKPMGSDLARHIEQALGIAQGWLDMPWDLIAAETSQAARPDPKTLAEAIKVAAGSSVGVTVDTVLMAYEMITMRAAAPSPIGRQTPGLEGAENVVIAGGNQGTLPDPGRKNGARKK